MICGSDVFPEQFFASEFFDETFSMNFSLFAVIQRFPSQIKQIFKEIIGNDKLYHKKCPRDKHCVVCINIVKRLNRKFNFHFSIVTIQIHLVKKKKIVNHKKQLHYIHTYTCSLKCSEKFILIHFQ